MTYIRRTMKVIENPNTRRRRIAAVGMYDGVHLGHRFLVEYLRREADRRELTPSVVTFRTHPLTVVRPLDAPRLLTSLDDRLRRLAAEGVDDLILLTFDEDMRRYTARQFLGALHKRYGVDALVVGFNNRFGHDRAEGYEQYKNIGSEIGMEVLRAPEYGDGSIHISSSEIRALLAEGEVRKANNALGRRHSFTGTVTKGKGLGRQIGYPTANITPVCENIMLPRQGVYVALATLPDGQRYPAVVNIGHRPTVDSREDAPLTIEAHVIDYNGYLYDDEITIEFVDSLRREKKFDSVEKLKAQIADDVKAALRILKLDK